jgi:iron complex transport system substrate-binding protein
VDAAQVHQAVAACRVHSNVVVLSPRTVSGIFASIREVGAAAGVVDRAETLVADLQRRLYAVASVAARAAHKPDVFSLEGVDPLVAGGHWIPEMKLLAGGRDRMFSPGCPATRLEWRQVTESDPEVLFLTLCSSDLRRSLREVHWLARQEGWWELRAVQHGQVYMIDHVYFSRPGPRVVDGIEILAQLIHPQLFSGLIPLDMVLKLDPSAPRGGCAPEELAGRFQPYRWP